MRNTKRYNFIAFAITLILCLAAAFVLTGCETEQKTLEDYLNDSPSAQQEVEEALSGLNNSDMDVTISYDQNRIIITGQMKTTYKKKVLKAMKKSYRKYMKKNLTDPMEDAISSIESETGITGVSIQVIINNGNGKEIWSGVYPQEEEGAAGTEETSGTDESSGGDQDAGAEDGSDESGN